MTNSDRQSFLDRIRVSRQELNKNNNNNQSNSEDNTEEAGPDKGQRERDLLKRCRRTKPNAVKQRKVSITAASRIATGHSVKETNRTILQLRGTTVTTTEDTTADAESIV